MQRLKVVMCLFAFFVTAFHVYALPGTPSSGISLKERIKEISLRIKQEPANGQAYIDRAEARSESKDFYGAIKDYTMAMVLVPTANAKTCTGRGNAFLEIGAYQNALKDFDKVLLNDSSTDALYGRAVAKYYLDDYLGAIRDLDEVIATAPEHSTALCNRGIVNLELNKLEEAIADLSSFLSTNPEHQEAAYAYSVATHRLQKRAAKH